MVIFILFYLMYIFVILKKSLCSNKQKFDTIYVSELVLLLIMKFHLTIQVHCVNQNSKSDDCYDVEQGGKFRPYIPTFPFS